jgi:hypothetical protein
MGFLCHLSMTYEQITPYLKGIYLTLSDHLPQQDDDGWKQTDRQWRACIHQRLSDRVICQTSIWRPTSTRVSIHSNRLPSDVKPVPQLLDNPHALNKVFEQTTPAPWACVRMAAIYLLKYGSVDASGCGGVGGTITTPTGIRLQEGVWGVLTHKMNHLAGLHIQI